MEKAPVVSVVIPAYNSADHISEALSSVFAQTFSDFEVILVNDGSPDTKRLEQVIRPFRQQLRYIKQANLGPSAARNTGIRAARGKWIAFLDADDSWMPEFLALQIKALNNDPSLDMVCSDSQLYGQSISSGMRFLELCPSKTPVTFESLVRGDSHVSTSCVVARRRVLVEAGLFDESFRRAEDYDLWLRVAFSGAKVGYQQMVLSRHRFHPDSLSTDSVAMIAAATDVLRKLERTLSLSPQRLALVRAALQENQAQLDLEKGKQSLREGNIGSAIDSLCKANALHRRTKLSLMVLGLRVAPRVTRWFAKILRG